MAGDFRVFFEEETEMGEDILPELAALSNSAFRDSGKDESMKEIEAKHMLSKNVENGLVLKVEDIIWRQLWPQTKGFDFGMQKNAKTHMPCAGAHA